MKIDIHTARHQWRTVVSAAKMTQAALKTRDLLQLAGNEPAAAHAEALYQSAASLLGELGQALTALNRSDDPEVQAFVRLLLDRLHRPPRQLVAAAPVPHAEGGPAS